MKRLAFFVFALLIFPLLVFAQPRAEPKAVWQPFAPVGEEFATEVPVTLSASSGLSAHRRYSGLINGTYFFVFSEPRANQSSVKTALEYINAFQKSGVSETFGGIESEKFSFDDDEGFSHQVFRFDTEKRSYLVHAVSATKNDQLVERFFGKLVIGKLNGAPVAEPANGESSLTVIGKTNDSGGLGTGQGGGMGSGSSGAGIGNGTGSGYGVGSGSGATIQAVQPQTNAPANSALAITTKPRPGYTNTARFYSVQGTVTLKVTFGADGQIGAVTPVTHLPFGLTKSAITAARSIQFKPQVQNGEPVSVTKTLEYSFAVY